MTMLLKTSSLFVILAAVMFSEYSCFEIKAIVDKVVPTSVQCFFRGKESSYSKENCNKNKDKEESGREHGSLDFFGRDIIKSLTRKNDDDVENEVEIEFSSATSGLDCNKTFFGGVVDSFKSKVRAIYPGTKWCGDGNISDSYNDLGKFVGTDSCCREHDLCPDSIAADKTKYGLENTGLFTRSHCDCDRKFYECLKNVDSISSKSIGFTYFTILGPQCFQEDYPVVSCVKRESRKCIRYRQDRRQSKKYQWFDSPTF